LGEHSNLRHADGSSTTGIVGVYNNGDNKENPTCLKSLEHITTPISTIKFHPTGQLLLTASTAKQDALKLVGYIHVNDPDASIICRQELLLATGRPLARLLEG
jgi:hypothetical protein